MYTNRYDQSPVLIILCCYGIAFIFAMVIYWKLISKTGFPGILSLLLIIPIVNIFFGLYMAFVEWPVEKKIRELKSEIKRIKNEK